MTGSSIVPSTWECEERICSMRVEPDLGSPRMKMGDRSLHPTPCRAAKNSRAYGRLQASVSLQRLGPVAALGLLQRVAALVKRERFRVLAPVLERLTERETQIIAVELLDVCGRLRGPHTGDFSVREAIGFQVRETPIRFAIVRSDRSRSAIRFDGFSCPAERLKRMRERQMQLGLIRRLGQNLTIERQGSAVVATSP